MWFYVNALEPVYIGEKGLAQLTSPIYVEVILIQFKVALGQKYNCYRNRNGQEKGDCLIIGPVKTHFQQQGH